MVYSTRRFVLCLTLYYFVLVFFSPFSIAITSLGEERAILSVFRTFVRFALVWFCLLPLPLGVWEGLRFVIVALPGLFSFFFSVGNIGAQTNKDTADYDVQDCLQPCGYASRAVPNSSLQLGKSYPFPEVPSNINYHCILQEQFLSTHNHNMELTASIHC